MTEKKKPIAKALAEAPAKPAVKKAVVKTAAVKKVAVKKAAAKKAAATKAVKKAAAVKKAPAKRAAEAIIATPAEKPSPSKLLADLALAALEDLKAVDIKVLDVSGLTTITDVMLIATGTSNRHASSLAHNVIDKVKENGHKPVGVEGLNEGEWVLVNLGGVIVHVMQAQARAFYQLEKLWDFQQREPMSRNAHA